MSSLKRLAELAEHALGLVRKYGRVRVEGESDDGGIFLWSRRTETAHELGPQRLRDFRRSDWALRGVERIALGLGIGRALPIELAKQIQDFRPTQALPWKKIVFWPWFLHNARVGAFVRADANGGAVRAKV